MSSSSPRETFRLGPLTTPRIWTGLWQLSSNAWGSTSVPKIRQGMARHVAFGYTAFGQSLFFFFLSKLCAEIFWFKFLDMVRLEWLLYFRAHAQLSRVFFRVSAFHVVPINA